MGMPFTFGNTLAPMIGGAANAMTGAIQQRQMQKIKEALYKQNLDYQKQIMQEASKIRQQETAGAEAKQQTEEQKLKDALIFLQQNPKGVPPGEWTPDPLSLMKAQVLLNQIKTGELNLDLLGLNVEEARKYPGGRRTGTSAPPAADMGDLKSDLFELELTLSKAGVSPAEIEQRKIQAMDVWATKYPHLAPDIQKIKMVSIAMNPASGEGLKPPTFRPLKPKPIEVKKVLPYLYPPYDIFKAGAWLGKKLPHREITWELNSPEPEPEEGIWNKRQ